MSSSAPANYLDCVKHLCDRYHFTQPCLAELTAVTPGLISQGESRKAHPFGEMSITDYMDLILPEDVAERISDDLSARITVDSIEAVEAEEAAVYGGAEDPREMLAA